MIATMKPREKALFGATLGIGLLFLLWSMGLEDLISSMTTGNSSVVREEKQYRSNLDSLQDILVVERSYRRIGQVPSATNKELSPSLAFTNEVFEISKNLGFQFPPIRAQIDDIDGVDDYQLLSVSIRTQGTFADTIKLLKTYQAAGLIFREIDLKSNRDRDVVDTSLVVSRIAEKPEQRRTTTTRRP